MIMNIVRDNMSVNPTVIIQSIFPTRSYPNRKAVLIHSIKRKYNRGGGTVVSRATIRAVVASIIALMAGRR
jgi:hypothetical protein